ncbi:hypothetical protein D3C80_1446110 [compost metagenome]
MQRQIDPGGDAGAGVNAAVFNKDAVFFHLRCRGLLAHAFNHVVMGGALVTVEQTGLCRQQGAGTDTDQRDTLLLQVGLQRGQPAAGLFGRPIGEEM